VLAVLRHAAHHTLPRIVPLVVLGAGVAFFVDNFSVARYVRGYFGEDYFADAYVDPARITLERGRKPPKSLVVIYVESLENTYSDPALLATTCCSASMRSSPCLAWCPSTTTVS
jgi:hypothetical protein